MCTDWFRKSLCSGARPLRKPRSLPARLPRRGLPYPSARGKSGTTKVQHTTALRACQSKGKTGRGRVSLAPQLSLLHKLGSFFVCFADPIHDSVRLRSILELDADGAINGQGLDFSQVGTEFDNSAPGRQI